MPLIGELERELDARAAAGLARRRRTIASPEGARVVVDGRELVAFVSNDYLGLAGDPDLADAVCAAVRRWGVGAGASHLLGGHFAAHAALETELAAFVRPCAGAAALTFSTGYLANLAILSALAGPHDAIFADRLDHACLNDLAGLYRTQGHYAQAEPLYKRALAIFEKALGSDHPAVAASLSILALLYYAQGQYAQAEAFLKRALAINEKGCPPVRAR